MCLLKVAHEAICVTDFEILDGTLGYYKDGSAKYPIILEHKSSGRIAQVGSKERSFQKCDWSNIKAHIHTNQDQCWYTGRFGGDQTIDGKR